VRFGEARPCSRGSHHSCNSGSRPGTGNGSRPASRDTGVATKPSQKEESTLPQRAKRRQSSAAKFFTEDALILEKDRRASSKTKNDTEEVVETEDRVNKVRQTIMQRRAAVKHHRESAQHHPDGHHHHHHSILTKLTEMHEAGLIEHHEHSSDEESSYSSSSSAEADQEPPACGMLLDIIRRKAEGAGGTTAGLLTQLAERDWSTFEYTKTAVLRDEFLAVVWEGITKFYKDPAQVAEAGHPGKEWPRTTTEHIRARVKEILAYKREVVCFKSEVHNWINRYKMLNGHVQQQTESMNERHVRMEDFWMQYHRRLRRNELPPVASATRMAVTGSGWRGASVSPKKAICFAGDEQWSMIERIEERSKPGRAGRSGAKFAKIADPAEGTPSRQSSKLGADLADRSPSRQSSKLPMLASGAPVSSLRKSASEPSIKGKASFGKSNGFTLPRIGGSGQDQELTSRPINSYLEACQRCWTIPTPLPFVTGSSFRLQAAGRNMMDSDLRAVAPLLQEVDSVQEVDLTGNNNLTEKALVPFLERLFGDPAASSLQRLCLKDVKRIGVQSMDIIRSLISERDGLRVLKSLDISHVHITPKCHLKLASAINGHSAIAVINLADTGLGMNPWIARQCMSLLMAETVTRLDIGWNCFDVETFQQLGKSISSAHIQALSLSNCSSACIDVNIPAPVSYFLEFLSQDETLTSLDVSLNRMDFRAMLIVEDSLACHTKIQKLDLSNNPLGVFGARSALRLLCLPTNSLIHFESSGCYSAGGVAGAQVFNMTSPGGRYSLDLTRPYHRSILRMLYKLCEHFKQPPDQVFLDVKYSNSKAGWSHTTKCSDGYFQVPREGTVKFVFSIEATIENSITGVADDDFEGFIDQHRRLTKVRPPFNKVIPLFASWKKLDGCTDEQKVFLNSMSKDFCLKPCHIELMCFSCPSMRPEVIYRLLPCVTGGDASESLVMLLCSTIGEFIKLHKKMRKFIDFNVENPTGHYKLDLSNHTEHSVAEKLLLLDRWEVVLAKRKGRRDVSQYGNGSHLRNAHYRNMPLHLDHKDIAEWTMPEIDEFECDYISDRRDHESAVPISDATFLNILVGLFDAECAPVSKLEVLRLMSHHIFMTAKQMRELLGSFRLEEHRAEVFVTFFLRVRDMWNAKIFRVRFANQEEIRRLQDRLGYATFFPFMQPENAQVSLDYRNHDQRICANILMQLAAKEGQYNIRSPELKFLNGTVDSFPTGLPRSWETLEKMPKDGVFTATYMCSPEHRKIAARQMLGETYGAFPMDVTEDKVLWWTGLTEVSEDVLDWLEFCIGNFKKIDDAFTAIDGADGNGVISLREFEDGVKELGCKKFKGKDESKRIEAIFRYLDPGGEGSVSKEEWQILGQLWQEYSLCIYEFVHFLQRTFGDDLKDAWEFLDDDGSGELSRAEWLTNCESIGYFGPGECVFALLDNSDDGSISLDEFMVLEAYKKEMPTGSRRSIPI